MKAVIMAGGKGTRLRPLTSNIPKPLVPIVNTPMIVHIIKLLKKHNFDEIFITISYLGKQIADLLGDGSKYGVSIKYFFEDRPLGTAGGVRQIQELDETFLVMSSDVLTDINLSSFLKFHKKKGGIASIALTREDIPVAYGIVIVDEKTRQVNRFLEKPSWSEVFSDKINAGIYLMEPEILKYIEEGVEYDFSHQLFPALLEKNEQLYGYIFNEYWLDIGDPEKYIKANHDILKRKLKLDIPGKEIRKGVWIGEDSEIKDDTNIWAPVLIGNNTKIDNDCFINRTSIIGDNVYIGKNNQIKRAIIWNGVSIGESCKLNNCVIANRVEIGNFTNIMSNAVIGDDCVIGASCDIRERVKIWPEKIIEFNSIVNNNVKWGTYVKRSLFGAYGLNGLVNIEITPEFCAKLGAAYGTCLGAGASVVIGTDTRSLSSMARRAIIAGLMSTGVNVYDLGIIPTPILKYGVNYWQLQGGIAISVPFAEEASINIRFFDRNGIDIDKKSEKKIENNFFKETFTRAPPLKLGTVSKPVRVVEEYVNRLFQFIDRKMIEKNNFKVVVDCADGSSSLIVPKILRKLGCEVITLNSQLGEELPIRPFSPSMENLSTLSKTTKVLDADLGIALDENANKVLFVDNKGNIIPGDTTLALISRETLINKESGTIVAPITTSSLIEKICEEFNGKLIRSKMGYREIIDDIVKYKAIFAGNESGGFIFPDFQLCEDGIISSIYILQLLSLTDSSFSELVSTIPDFYMTKDYIHTPLHYRGKILYTLIEENYTHKIEAISGIKIYFNYGWCLIVPNPFKEGFDIYAEAKNNQYANELVKHWKNQINDIIHRIDTGDI
ncbi:MAG: sugar phosphate nucleotidyltransferase [Candidatus Helarchaeota archaeon]